MQQTWARWLVLGFWGGVVGLYQWYAFAHHLTPTRIIQGWVDLLRLPFYGPLLYFLFHLAQPLLFFPSWLLTVAAGFLYGTWLGLCYTLVAATCAAYLSYWVGRFFAPDFILAYQADNILHRYANSLRTNTFEAVLILRLLFLPFDVLSYVAGFLRIPWRPFLLATLLGSIPGALSFTLFGAAFDGNFAEQAPKVDPRTLIIAVVIFALSLGLSRLLKRRQPMP